MFPVATFFKNTHLNGFDAEVDEWGLELAKPGVLQKCLDRRKTGRMLSDEK